MSTTHLCANLSDIFTLLKLTQNPKLTHVKKNNTSFPALAYCLFCDVLYMKCFKLKKWYCVIILSY